MSSSTPVMGERRRLVMKAGCRVSAIKAREAGGNKLIPMAAAIDTNLTKYAEEALDALDGLPPDDLNAWKPRQELADINTFFALATHLVAAGEFWTLHAVGGRPTIRDRAAEFL